MVQSVGRWLLLSHYASEFTMPAMVGGLFLPVLLLSLWGLNQLPPPNAADIAARVKRGPMNGKARRELFAHYAPGLIVLIALYVLLTAMRDFRDNFAAEIWQSVGLGDKADIFALSDLPVGVVVLLAMATLALFRKNRPALIANLSLIGFGLLFDRLVAATGKVGTAGFLIYIADANGYAGSVALLLLKNFAALKLPWVEFLMGASVFIGVGGLACLAFAGIYLWRKLKT